MGLIVKKAFKTSQLQCANSRIAAGGDGLKVRTVLYAAVEDWLNKQVLVSDSIPNILSQKVVSVTKM
jgi:hypothetical protein